MTARLSEPGLTAFRLRPSQWRICHLPAHGLQSSLHRVHVPDIKIRQRLRRNPTTYLLGEAHLGQRKPVRTFNMSTIPPATLKSGVPPIIPLDFNGRQPQTVKVYPLSNYTFGVKETQPEEDPSVIARLKRLEEHYTEHGMRRTCEAILICHEHNHPHILMLQIANTFFKLPGDYLKPEEDEVEGFKARLDERLAPVGRIGEGEKVADWEVGECLSQWWRPNFETFMYPYVPAHVTRPKECKKIYLIHLPKTSTCRQSRLAAMLKAVLTRAAQRS